MTAGLALALAGCGPSLEDVVAEVTGSGFQGVIHVEHRGELRVLDAWGVAVEATAREPAVRNTPETVFSIGSLTKQFTAAAVLEARDRGLLSLDDTLADHFEGVPADRAHATLHQLLCHTAGFRGALGPDEEVVDREVYLARAWASPLVSEPGERFAYSNVGYGLLAAALEQRTGMPYDVVLEAWFFGPLDLAGTGYERPERSGAVVAHGYRGDVDYGPPLGARYDTEGPFWHVTGNGEILSTAADLRRWTEALAEGRALRPASRDLMWDRHVRQWPGAFYGYGWGVEEWPLAGWNVNHDGSNGYFFAHLIWWPDEELYVAVLSNHDPARSADLGWRLSRAAL